MKKNDVKVFSTWHVHFSYTKSLRIEHSGFQPTRRFYFPFLFVRPKWPVLAALAPCSHGTFRELYSSLVNLCVLSTFTLGIILTNPAGAKKKGKGKPGPNKAKKFSLTGGVGGKPKGNKKRKQPNGVRRCKMTLNCEN